MSGNRKRLRLKEYNYSQAGNYFLTICTKNRIDHFGEIVNQTMELNQEGMIAFEMWKGIQSNYDNIILDEFTVMPNHLHGLISIIDGLDDNDRTKMLIPKIVQAYKAEVTRRVKRISGIKQKVSLWQNSYYDRIIRNEKEFENVQAYIHYNAEMWELDIENRINELKARDEKSVKKYYDKIFGNIRQVKSSKRTE